MADVISDVPNAGTAPSFQKPKKSFRHAPLWLAIGVLYFIVIIGGGVMVAKSHSGVVKAVLPFVKHAHKKSVNNTSGEGSSGELSALKYQIALIKATLKKSGKAPQLEANDLLSKMHIVNAELNLNLAKSLLIIHGADNEIAASLLAAEQAVSAAGLTDPMNAIKTLRAQQKLLPKVSPNSVLQRLATLEADLAQLTFKQPVVVEKSALPKSKGWKDALHHSWQQIHALIVVQDKQTIGQVLLSSKARFNAVKLLKLRFGEARWATIRSDEASYQSAVQHLIDLTKQLTINNAEQQHWLVDAKALLELHVGNDPHTESVLIGKINYLLAELTLISQGEK